MKTNRFIFILPIALVASLFLAFWNFLISQASQITPVVLETNLSTKADVQPPSTILLAAPTTPDTEVTEVYPVANSHNASLTTTLAITLSGAINEATVSTQTIFVHGSGHGHIDGAITFGSIHYDPNQNFFPGELVQTSVTDGILDSNGTPIIPYVWEFRAAAGVGPGTFADSGQSLGSTSTNAVALGDVDGDGDLDAFIGKNGVNQLWLNDGAGIFTNSGQSLGSSLTEDVMLGDVDGDNDLDAFVVNAAIGNFNEVWLNDGAGLFTNSGQNLQSLTSVAVALGDVDGDGDLDAFVGNYNGEPDTVWLNDGAGTFTNSGQSLGDTHTLDVALGDLDSDGDLDAFVGNENSQPDTVWLNDGAGTFTNSGQSLGNSASYAVVLGDVDGDGDLDAFVANNWGTPDKIWLNNGAGIFIGGQNLGNYWSRTAALGDIDGDGDLDAIVGTDGGQPNKLWLNNGAGTFTDSGQSLGSSSPYAVDLGDVDGDGDLDALLGINSSQSNEMWLNAVRVTQVSPPANSHDAPQTATLAITLNDIISEASVTTQTVFIHGDGHGHMDGDITFDATSILYNPYQNFFPGELVQTSITTKVLDSRGNPLDAPYVWQFRIAAGTGSGIFNDSGQNLGSFISRGVAVGDVDGDGDLDAYFGIEGADKLWLNDGMGNFTESGQTLDSMASADVALGDLDGDGDLDVFIVNTSQANKVWLNNGAGIFTDSGQNMGVAVSTSVALGDVDGDGDLDAFVGNWGQPNEVWLNDGTGTFTNSGQAMGNDITLAVALGDVDADGDLDAFFGNRDGSNKVWRNDGAGTFTNSGQNLGSDDTYAVALGDVDGDGDLDAFVGNLGGANKVWRNNGTGTFTNSGQNLGNEDTWAVAFGDVEGDGDLDAFVGNYFGQPDQVWLNNGAGTFTNSGQTLGSSNTLAAALGDVDGDGDLDALVGNHNSPNKVWLNAAPEVDISSNGQSIPNGDTTPSTSDSTAFGSTPTTGGTVVHTFTIHNTGDADLNLTGTPDVILTTGTHFNVTVQPASSIIAPGNTITFEITFNPLASGTFMDTVTIANNDGDENPYTFTISGTGTNTPPSAVNDTYTTTEDVPLVTTSPGVLDNDTDVDSDPLTAVLNTNPSHGTLTLNGNGSFNYTPNPNYCGADNFIYHAYDGQTASGLATVSLTVTCLNDAPLAVSDTYTTTEGTFLIIAAPGVLDNDTDGDSDPLAAVLNTDPNHGTLSLNSDGGFDYTPDLDYCGTDSFNYHAYDGQAPSGLATVTLTVTCANNPPLATGDIYTTTKNAPLVIAAPGALANDTDADGDSLTALLDTAPSAGTLVLNSDGSFVYTPTLEYTGVITFTYTVSDGLDISEPVTVTIIVQAAPVTEFKIYLPAVIR